MCGIVGVVGAKNPINIIIEGLKKLEYRGYDSAGIATIDDKKFKKQLASGSSKSSC